MPILSNWNEEIKFLVPDDKFKTPSSISEVQTIIKDAAQHSEKVRVIGAMHSTTQCMVDNGITISMKNMAEILHVDEEHMTATVQAGVTIHQLCEYLKPRGYQPPVILEYGNFQIGAISGTQANDSSLSDSAQFASFVVGVKLIKADGQMMEISETQNAEHLHAIRSHYGLFGVVCEVTVRIWKTRHLEFSYEMTTLDAFSADVIGNVNKLRNSYDQAFGLLFQADGKFMIQKRKFVDNDTKSPHPLTNNLEAKAINLYADLVLPLAKANGQLRLPAHQQEWLSTALVDLPLRALSHSKYIIDPNDRAVPYRENQPHFDFFDWVFPEENWSAMAHAWISLCNTFEAEKNFVLTLPCLVYFLKKDDNMLLSRSRGGNMMAIDPEYEDPTNPKWLEFRLAFSEVAKQHGGIPHINKTRDGAIKWFAEACDQDALERYLEQRKEFDPEGMFVNEFFATMFEGRM
ncbi:FAD-binding domain-containing protein, partial [Aureobasidium melanogenum]